VLRTRAGLYKTMQHHTGKDKETITRDCERDKWLDAEEAVAYGCGDQVLQHIPDSLAGGGGSDDDE